MQKKPYTKQIKDMKILLRTLSLPISMLVIFGFSTLATSVHPKTAFSDKMGILEQKDIVHILVGKTIHVGVPSSKIYFTSSSMATIHLLEGDNYKESEVVNWVVNKNNQFCFTARLINGIESCYKIERLKSGNFLISLERKGWRTKFYLPKNKIVVGKDF